jgi:hypothetical protein
MLVCRRRLARRASGRQCVEKSPDIRLPVTNEPADADERDAGPDNTILLKRRAGATRDAFDISVREQGVKHAVPLGIARTGAPQKIARCNFQKYGLRFQEIANGI